MHAVIFEAKRDDGEHIETNDMENGKKYTHYWSGTFYDVSKTWS